MNEERRKILDMLAQGKITVEEAEKLLAAVGETGTGSGAAAARGRRRAALLEVPPHPGRTGPE